MFFAGEAEAGAQTVQPHEVKQQTRQHHGEGGLHRVGGKCRKRGGGRAVDEGVADEVARHHERARHKHGRSSRDGRKEFSPPRGAKEPHQQPADQPFQPLYHQSEEHGGGVDGEVREKGAYPARQHRGERTEQRGGDKDHRVAAVEEEIPRAEAQHHRGGDSESSRKRGEYERARRECEFCLVSV